MNGTLSITADLALLSKLAVQIEDWFPNATSLETRPESYLSWDIDSIATLLKRLHPWQLLLFSFVARGDGRRSDPEVRAKFAIDGSGLRGQTGPISKHVKAMRKEGLIDAADWVLVVDRTTRTPMFVMPERLVPIAHAALDRPDILQALQNARNEHFDERE